MASPGAGLPSIMRPVKGLVQRQAHASKRGRPSSGKTRFTVILLAILAVAAMVPFMSLSGAAVASASARGPETASRIFDLGVHSVESVRHSVESVQDMIGSMAFWHHDEAAPPLVSPSSTGHCAACHELRVFIAISSDISSAAARRRQLQRDTWLRWMNESEVSSNAEYRFFLTGTNESFHRARASLEAEQLAHDDVVFLIIADPPRSRAASASSARIAPWTAEVLQTEWALEHSIDFAFILHLHDDGLLCAHRVTEELHYRPTERFVWTKYVCNDVLKVAGSGVVAPDIAPGFLLFSRDVAELLYTVRFRQPPAIVS